jgi:pimeloyl-ACP methyl ester carboxylesterase
MTLGLILAPENRNDPNSRKIDVHYLRFHAREEAKLPPLFILPGGPGGFIGAAHVRSAAKGQRYSSAAEVIAFNRLRDVVVVNQRGNGKAPIRHKLPARWTADAGNYLEPRSQKTAVPRLADGFAAAVKQCEEQGFDLRGYDILHLVDDVEAIREAYRYEKIALRGSSFGSQWSLAYHRRHPQRVDRMLLAGVEPLDLAGDHPDWIWNVYERIEAEARQSLELPKIGLLGAVKAIVERLEKKPLEVRGVHPKRKIVAKVKLGPGDFQYYLHRRYPRPPWSIHYRKTLGELPKFVMEIFNGDYDYLASRTIDDRPEKYRGQILLTLVDNSLGIPKFREDEFNQSVARRWLGDINHSISATRGVAPTPVVSDEFRAAQKSTTPLLMVHGDLDLSTPIENAEGLLELFPNGKLLRVQGGTHGATTQAQSADKNFVNYLIRYVEADEPNRVELPKTIKLPPLKFAPLGKPSLFDQLTGRR